MKPKEKAFELYNKFDMIIYTDQDHYRQVKSCAKRCVDEIVSSIQYREGTDEYFTGYEYWNKVKQEIELL